MQGDTTPLSFSTVSLATGVELHYAEQGAPAGQPIVLLHGLTDSWFSFSRLLPLLDRERYHVFALDQRGHGDSGRPPEGFTPEDFAADVPAFMEAVGLDKAAVVGHSMGSIVARRVAERYPARVSRLVLIAPILRTDSEVVQELRALFSTLQDPVPTEFAHEWQEANIGGPVPAQFVDRAVSESLKVPARIWREALDGVTANDDRDEVAGIAAPTLLLWGDRDAFCPRSDQDFLVATIPDATLKVYPEVGHTVHWENPTLVAADLDAFLQGE